MRFKILLLTSVVFGITSCANSIQSAQPMSLQSRNAYIQMSAAAPVETTQSYMSNSLDYAAEVIEPVLKKTSTKLCKSVENGDVRIWVSAGVGGIDVTYHCKKGKVSPA